MSAGLPNFTAITNWIVQNRDALPHQPIIKWLEKLEPWCEERLKEVERKGVENNSLEQMLSEMQDYEDSYRSLVELAQDVERGIRTQQELWDAVSGVTFGTEVSG